MFKVMDKNGRVYVAYGTFIDENGDIQFILCSDTGKFYQSNPLLGPYTLYQD